MDEVWTSGRSRLLMRGTASGHEGIRGAIAYALGCIASSRRPRNAATFALYGQRRGNVRCGSAGRPSGTKYCSGVPPHDARKGRAKEVVEV